MNKRWRTASSAAMSLIAFSSVVVLATQADGRVATAAESNDGSAWFVDRIRGGAANIEHGSHEASVEVPGDWESGSLLSAHQSDTIAIVHDATAGTVTSIDRANAQVHAVASIPLDSQVAASGSTVAVYHADTGRFWSVPFAELPGKSSFEEVPATYTGSPGATQLATAQGQVALVSEDLVVWPTLTGSDDLPQQTVPDGFSGAEAALIENRVVLVGPSGVAVVTPDSTTQFAIDGLPAMAELQQSSSSWPLLAGVSVAGAPVMVDLQSRSLVALADIPAPITPTTKPVVLDGIVYVLGKVDGDMGLLSRGSDGSSGLWQARPEAPENAQLRVVNGFVWVDNLNATGYVAEKDLTLSDIADFSDIFDTSEGEESADGTNVEERVTSGNEDGALVGADERDDNPENRPPVAEDDEATTRVGRPIVVDVLANDTDPDSDVILVADAVLAEGSDGAIVEVPAARNSVQITPAPGQTKVEVTYRISDGHPGGEATAKITLDVLPSNQDGNRAPVPKLDRLAGAAGGVLSINVLENDDDPDGDALILTNLAANGAELRSLHPGGDVLLSIPELATEGTLDLPYSVVDEWGAEAEGILRIDVRLSGSNEAPDARNDAGSTQVGNPILMNLLANDVDADGDLLGVGIQATYLGSPSDDPGLVSSTEDGEFLFVPNHAGTFLFEYAATDKTESDTALVRIEVEEPTENRPPVAVRDDVTLARNETRLVRIFDNDGDVDGDLFSVALLYPNENLVVEQIDGLGFRITMSPGADVVETLQYSISDGRAESNLASIIVTRADLDYANAAPVTNDDVVRVRAGRTSKINVLQNDYDPEGGPLLVVEATDVDGMDAEPGAAGQWVSITVVPGQTQPEKLVYTVQDEEGDKAAGQIEVSIVPPSDENSAPVARPDRAWTREGQAVVIPVLLNDSDPESDAITLISENRSPANGSLAINEEQDGFVYTPAKGFVGTDRFTYLIQDSEGMSSVGVVAVGVMAASTVNHPPEAIDDLDVVFQAGAGEQPIQVLSNDSDPDGDEIHVIAVSPETAATFPSSGSLINFAVPATVTDSQTFSFNYTIADPGAQTDSARVVVTVLPTVEKLPPVAVPDTTKPVKEGDTVSVNVRANDEDPDGSVENLVVSVNEPGMSVSRGVVSIVAPAESREFAYTITDPDGLTDSSYITVTVEPNLAPVVIDKHLGTFFTDDAIGTIDLSKLATDPDGDKLVFNCCTSQQGGQPGKDPNAFDNRLVTFIADADFSGEAGFNFTVEDDHNHVVSGRVTLTLKGKSNEPPVGIDKSVELEAGLPVPFSLSTLFTDPDAEDVLTYVVTAGPEAPVVATRNGDQVVLAAPISSPAVRTTLVVTAKDPGGESAKATLSITLAASSVALPQTTPDTSTTNQEKPVTLDVTANDLDNLGEGLTIVSQTSQGGGSVSASGNSLTFTPGAGEFGTKTVIYTVEDGRGAAGQAEGTWTINVIGRPSAPTGLSASEAGSRSGNVTWNAPSGNGATIDYYEVRLNNSDIRKVGANPSAAFTNLTNGTTYTFEVRAHNTAGDSQWSSTSNSITPDVLPGAPGKPTVTFGTGNLNVSWVAGPNDGSAITHYKLEIGNCASSTRDNISSTSISWTGLTNGTPCRFRATAVNARGDSPVGPWSELECPVALPFAPVAPQATRGDKQASITWSAPQNPDCQSVIDYSIRRSDGNIVTAASGTQTWLSSPLQNGQSYSFQVSARNRAGAGPWSPASNVVIPCGVPLKPPSAPTADEGDTLAPVSMAQAAPANGCAVSSYQVSANGAGPASFAGTATSWSVTGLANGTPYTFRVRGVNEEGPGEWSNTSNSVTPFGKPFAVTNFAFDSSAGSTCWAWNVPGDNGSPITGYGTTGSTSGSVYASSCGGQLSAMAINCANQQGGICLHGGSATKTPPSGCLQTAQTVSATVWAINRAGNGPSNTKSFGLSGCPGAPTLTFSNVTTANYTVNWNRPAGTSNIYVQVDNGGYGSPVGGSSKQYGGAAGSSHTVVVWACNGYGCSKTSKSVSLLNPSVSASYSGSTAWQPPGCTGACQTINFSWSGLTPNQNVTFTCDWTVPPDLSYTLNTGSGSGSGNTNNWCADTPGDADRITIVIDGVRSNTL